MKADIGVRGGRIVGIGKAGNPDVMPDVHPDMVVGSTTFPVQGHNFIVTAGAVESHAHLISPQQSEHALSGGTTTMIGNGSGPVFDVGSGGPEAFERFLQAAAEFSPVNYALFGRGASRPESVEQSIAAGGASVKIHEEFGAAPAVIDQSLIAADRNDFAVHLHTDSINEFGFCEARWRRSAAAPSTCITSRAPGADTRAHRRPDDETALDDHIGLYGKRSARPDGRCRAVTATAV